MGAGRAAGARAAGDRGGSGAGGVGEEALGSPLLRPGRPPESLSGAWKSHRRRGRRGSVPLLSDRPLPRAEVRRGLPWLGKRLEHDGHDGGTKDTTDGLFHSVPPCPELTLSAEALDFFRAFPDQKLDNRPYRVFFASGDRTCSIARFTGTFSGPMRGPDGKDIAPTGRGFEVQFCTVAHWGDDGQIIEENLFYDLGSFMAADRARRVARIRRHTRAVLREWR
jgi:hypothetical protein